MGYYSTLNCGEFKVKDKEKATEIFKKYREENDYFFYHLEFIKDNRVTIIPDDKNYTAKHYADKDLARAILQVISPGEVTEITFDGEDGTKWGYRITYNKIEELDFVPLSEKEKHILNEIKKLDINSLKFVLKSYINNLALEPEEFANAMMELHPTLQQTLMRLFVAWCQQMATLQPYDNRNKASIQLAKEIVKLADKIHLPLI